ncbi:MAG: hypothetical protein MUE69_14880 [Myxococcota bacterium]|jgi:hypothetical protein|nr:hypothetical protein [Myxococcota bacterium]
MAWLGAFVLTQLVEAPLYAWCLRRWSTSPTWERVAVAFLPSALTHPLLWLGFPTLREHLSYVAAVGVAEALVVVVEAVVIARFLDAAPVPGRVALAFGAAGVVNALSVAAGLASRALFDWP